MVAATETKEPEQWLAYAQDRKQEDPRYSVASFRRDIQMANLTQSVPDAHEDNQLQPGVVLQVALPVLEHRACPWLEVFCVRSGRPLPLNECRDCEFENNAFLRNEAKV